MPRVYVVNTSGHDISDAERYGELVVMTEGTVDKFNITIMLRAFNEHLAYSTSDDFILVSGPTVMNCIACAMFAAKHGCLNLLLWRYERDGEDRYVHERVRFRLRRQVRKGTKTTKTKYKTSGES